MEMDKCPLCGAGLVRSVRTDINFCIFNQCRFCGTYKISEVIFLEKYKDKLWILSGLARLRTDGLRGIAIFPDTIDDLISSAPIPKGPIEIIDRLLLFIYDNIETAADYVELTVRHYPVCFAKGIKEFQFILRETEKLNYITKQKGSTNNYRLTVLDGWKRVNELNERRVRSDQAFVAMWFSDDLNEAWKSGFEPALNELRYRAIRIDAIEHNEKIDDRIISEIRRSGLLVADFTGQRAGVYFEAGFAYGLGIPVIWTCHKDHVKGLHFDTRQYNHIVWENPEELKMKLQYRIKATIPLPRPGDVKKRL